MTSSQPEFYQLVATRPVLTDDGVVREIEFSFNDGKQRRVFMTMTPDLAHDLGLDKPFIKQVAWAVMENYIERGKGAILCQK
jgi:hypothetical protein